MYFVTLDVFTDKPFEGNPLALVIVTADERAALDEERSSGGRDTRQLIAREFNLSETAFLYLAPGETLDSPDRSSSRRDVSIYTTESELPFAGHPTIGTAYFILKRLGWTFVDTIVPPAGPIAISTNGSGSDSSSDGVTARIPHDVHHHAGTLRTFLLRQPQGEEGKAAAEGGRTPAAERVARALNPEAVVREAELDAPVVSIVRGMSFLLVRLPSLRHLGMVDAAVGTRLDLGGGQDDSVLDEGPWGLGFMGRYYYVLSPEGGEEEEKGKGEKATGEGVRTLTVRTRMIEGPEDPATGSAASTLACHLSLASGEAGATTRYLIRQGVEMGRTSDIQVDVTTTTTNTTKPSSSTPSSDDTGAATTAVGERVVQQVCIGGSARLVMTGDVKV